MISASLFQKVQKQLTKDELIVKNEMPNAHFSFIGFDDECIYFKVICKMSQTNETEIRDVEQKTPFYISENVSSEGVFNAYFVSHIF